jgi:hypothetical protein
VDVSRREFLKQTQNADGGWGYFPRKRSWLEPTVYAALALYGEPAFERAWALIRSWALPDGGWRMSADVAESNWTSALCLTLYCVQGVADPTFYKGLDQMLDTVGAEGSFLRQLGLWLHPEIAEMDYGLQGWPWRKGNSSWVEPTAHALLAMKKAANQLNPGSIRDILTLRERVRVAERMMLDRRCLDGGWNYGNKLVRGEALPSYPETTALALLGMQGSSPNTLRSGIQLAEKNWRETRSPLAKAWLTISLRNYGLSLDNTRDEETEIRPTQDILLAALQCLAEAGGGHQHLTPGLTRVVSA